MAEQAPQTSPRGTDRRRRRADQAKHAEQANAEIQTLTSPQSEEKAAAVARVAERDKQVTTTPGGVRKVRQAVNRAKAEAEPVSLPSPQTKVPRLVPGQQVDLRTANLKAQADDVSERDFAQRAAEEAGIAVRSTLRGTPLRDRHNRSRHIAEHNARVEARQRAAEQQK